MKYYQGVSPTADSSRVGVSNKGKYVNKVLDHCFIKLAQEKVWFG